MTTTTTNRRISELLVQESQRTHYKSIHLLYRIPSRGVQSKLSPFPTEAHREEVVCSRLHITFVAKVEVEVMSPRLRRFLGRLCCV